jgi:stress-induced morphogen
MARLTGFMGLLNGNARSTIGSRFVRRLSLQAPADLGDYEKEIFTKLANSLDPQVLDVRDVSGGCGSMFAINVASKKFEGLTMIKQHRLVNEILAEDIQKWHGLQLRTKKAD